MFRRPYCVILHDGLELIEDIFYLLCVPESLYLYLIILTRLGVLRDALINASAWLWRLAGACLASVYAALSIASLLNCSAAAVRVLKPYPVNVFCRVSFGNVTVGVYHAVSRKPQSTPPREFHIRSNPVCSRLFRAELWCWISRFTSQRAARVVMLPDLCYCFLWYCFPFGIPWLFVILVTRMYITPNDWLSSSTVARRRVSITDWDDYIRD